MTGTFPLNVQAGSPQYTLASEISPTSSTTTIIVSMINPSSIDPISNAYYTIQNEDGSKWCTFYVESWTKSDSYIPFYTGSCTYTSSNTSDVFPQGSICWCIWCKEYYDSLIAQIGGGGNTVKVSQLEWDTNLVIPDGHVIESASGEVGIVGDVSISGSLSAEDNVSTPLLTATNTDIDSLTVSGYTPVLIQSSGNTFSYNGNGSNPLLFPSIPQGGVKINGSANLRVSSAGDTQTIRLYARCMSFGGKISDVIIATANSPPSYDINANITNIVIPAKTQFIAGLYATTTAADGRTVTINSVNFTSDSYSSKALI